MHPHHPYRHSRMNLADLKAQMAKKLGLEASKQYFHCLNRFLSLKLTKVEFSKLCFRIVGRENIPLHNQLICSILRNACTAKFPPLGDHKDDVLKCGQVVDSDVSTNGYQPNGLLNGGDGLPLSPRKARTGLRKTGAYRMALGPHGKNNLAPQMPAASQSTDFSIPLENGNVHPSSIEKPRQQVENENKMTVPHSLGRRTRDGPVPLCSQHNEAELVFRDDAKEDSTRSPLGAPLGVQYFPISTTAIQRVMPPASSSRFTCTGNNVLPDNLALRDWMEQISVLLGLEGESLDSAIVLNQGLNSYMKGLIGSCIELMGARSGLEMSKNHTEKHHNYTKLVNGVRLGYQYQIQNSEQSVETQLPKTQSLISLQDFRVAMELNPQKLGADWPLLLEKICTQSFEK